MSFGDSQFWAALASIIGINLVLAGDNAVVIAMAARGLAPSVARKAVVYGTIAAVVLRILLTSIVVILFQIPYVKLVGGILLLWIAWRLAHEEDDPNVEAAGELRAAVITILTADLVMSLDNVVAVAAAAHGNIMLIVIGLAISIPIVMGGAQLLLGLIHRFPIIVWIGVALIVYTGVELIFSDALIHDWIESLPEGSILHEQWFERLVAVGAAVSFTVLSWLHVSHSKRKSLLKVEGSAADDTPADPAT